MDHRETTLEADKIHQNRLPSITDDDEEQDAAFTIVRVLDKVATIVDSVQASQKRIEERHREMEDAIKTIQIDLLKLAQAHGNTGYTVNKLLQKTRKVSARVKEVRARVEKQSSNVRKVEAKQEEMLRKNKFRVVIYQEDVPCPSSLSVIKDRTQGEHPEDAFCLPDDLSSDEEYYMEESKASRFKKSGMKRIDNIRKAFSRENIQKTRQNFGKKVDRLRTRIVTPERRERIRQSGERLRQSGIRFKKTISKAAPTKETFKKKKTKEPAATEDEGRVQEAGADMAVDSREAEPVTEEISYTEVITKVKKDRGGNSKAPLQAEEKKVITPEKIMLRPEVKEDEDVLLLDLKPSA
ncbi:caveolae-associated protein 4 [Sphaerodactylus townsendi]|uniref:caveolae-associated protein 4 n=1 Tax=Sphaerodactylus townsendi TaxID=933632 RepID=UPI0020267B8F|nr:caveolae-associated protein 4 [Sphaerodactylus townsendi]